MEMVAWLAGEEHSDGPRCACPVVAAVVRAFNDALPDDAARSRQLRPLIPRIVNTRRDGHEERRRGYLVTDYAVRVFAPIALERLGNAEAAQSLRRLPAVVDRACALLAASTLQLFGSAVAPAAWVAARAAGTLPPAVWVGGVVRQVQEARDDRAHALLGLLIEQLLAGEFSTEALPAQGMAELG